MILGFTKKKIMSIILLLGCIFISLAMSHIPFLVSEHKAGINMEGMQEGITSPLDDINDEEDNEGVPATTTTTVPATTLPVTTPISTTTTVPATTIPVNPPTPITTTIPATIIGNTAATPITTTIPATIIGNTAATPTTITTPPPAASLTTTPVSASTTLTTTSTTPTTDSNSPTTLANVPSTNASIQTTPSSNVKPYCSTENLLSAKILMSNMDYAGVKNILNSCII